MIIRQTIFFFVVIALLCWAAGPTMAAAQSTTGTRDRTGSAWELASDDDDDSGDDSDDSGDSDDDDDDGDNHTTLAVQAYDDMNFNSLYRLETRTMGYLDPNAARFVITAKPKRTLLLSVLTARLSRVDAEPEADRTEMPIDVAPEDCAFSLDEGVTWTAFTSTIQNQVVKTPKAPPGERTCRILVWIGGSINASTIQRRGNYHGEVTLTVEYQ